MSLRIVLAAAAALLLASAAHAAPRPVPLLDAHTHLMIENLTADEEIALLKKAGVDRVLLMHTDPDALAALARKYPGFVIPSLSLARPNVKGLHLDADTGPLMLRLRQARQICGFGEIPGFIFGDNPDFRSIYAAAAATGAPVNIHTDLARPENIAALEAAASAFPKAHLVLAHLGWTAGPDLIGRLLDAHPNLYTDVSIRFEPPGSLPWRNNGLDLSILTADRTLQPGWRAVIERHPDRFLFAMDINSFGPRYTITDELVATARTALAPLPRRIQQAIGHANAERLLAGCRP